MMRRILWILFVFAAAIVLLYLIVPARAQQTYWFQVTNGDTTCRAFMVQPSPFRFSYLCENPRGSTGGSYTAAGNSTLDTITIGLTSFSASGGLAMIAVNTTAVDATVGSFGVVPAGSVAWQVNAQAVGTMPIAPPSSVKVR